MHVEYPCLAAGLLEPWRPTLGLDFAVYSNHAYRVWNFCLALTGDNPDADVKIAIATVYHDLGISRLCHLVRIRRNATVHAGPVGAEGG